MRLPTPGTTRCGGRQTIRDDLDQEPAMPFSSLSMLADASFFGGAEKLGLSSSFAVLPVWSAPAQ